MSDFHAIGDSVPVREARTTDFASLVRDSQAPTGKVSVRELERELLLGIFGWADQVEQQRIESLSSKKEYVPSKEITASTNAFKSSVREYASVLIYSTHPELSVSEGEKREAEKQLQSALVEFCLSMNVGTDDSLRLATIKSHMLAVLSNHGLATRQGVSKP